MKYYLDIPSTRQIIPWGEGNKQPLGNIDMDDLDEIDNYAVENGIDEDDSNVESEKNSDEGYEIELQG